MRWAWLLTGMVLAGCGARQTGAPTPTPAIPTASEAVMAATAAPVALLAPAPVPAEQPSPTPGALAVPLPPIAPQDPSPTLEATAPPEPSPTLEAVEVPLLPPTQTPEPSPAPSSTLEAFVVPVVAPMLLPPAQDDDREPTIGRLPVSAIYTAALPAFRVEQVALEGADIQQVTFSFINADGSTIYQRTDTEAPFCAFGTEQCTALRRDGDALFWPDGRVVAPGTYTMLVSAQLPGRKRATVQTAFAVHKPAKEPRTAP